MQGKRNIKLDAKKEGRTTALIFFGPGLKFAFLKIKFPVLK